MAGAIGVRTGDNRSIGYRRCAVWLGLFGLVVAVLVWWLVNEPPRTRQLVWNSLMLAFGATVIAVPLGTGLAWLIESTDVWGRSVARTVMAVLLFLPLYLQVAAWDAGFGLQGWFPWGTSLAGGEPLLWKWRGAIWIHAVAAVPWVTLLLGIGLRWVDRQSEEAALMDAGRMAVFLRITMPAIGPWMLVASLWILVWTAGEMSVTDIYQVHTLIEEVYTGYALDDPGADGGIAAVPLSARSGTILLMVLLLVSLYIVSQVAPGRVEVPWAVRRAWPLGRWRWVGSIVLLLALVVLLGIPLLNLLYQAGMGVELLGDERVRRWSWTKALRMTMESPWQFRTEWAWTLVIAQLASLAAVAFALPLAWWARGNHWARGVIWWIAAICLAFPGPVWGIWCGKMRAASVPVGAEWIWDQTILAPWLGLTGRSLPLACLILWHAFQTVPRETLQVAEVDGARWWWRLWAVAVPQRTAALAAAWLLALTVAWGDLAMSILTVPPGVTTLAIRIFGLVHYGVHDQLAGLCLASMALIGILTLTGFRLMKR